MLRKTWAFTMVSALMIINTAYAADTRIIIAPTCLSKKITVAHTTLAATPNFSLFTLDAENRDELMNLKHSSRKVCGGFMDVTNDWQTKKVSAQMFLVQHTEMKPAKPMLANYKIQYPKQVNALLKQVNPQNMWNNLSVLTNFDDRYAYSQNGIEAASWIKQQITQIAKDNHRQDVSVSIIATGADDNQPSVIAKIGNNDTDGVVVGAHMDTLSSRFSLKPGADDDGSGSVTTLEAARTILASGMHFKKPIYFIWYAAEEEGMIGSGYVVNEFKHKNIPISAVIQFDMTGYAYHNESTLWLMRDYVNLDLTTYLADLISTYLKQPVKYSACGYACSDHATWTMHGYPAVIAAETAYENTNPNLHSSHDTMDKLSLTHMTDYAKLAVAFAVELAEPVDA